MRWSSTSVTRWRAAIHLHLLSSTSSLMLRLRQLQRGKNSHHHRRGTCTSFQSRNAEEQCALLGKELEGKQEAIELLQDQAHQKDLLFLELQGKLSAAETERNTVQEAKQAPPQAQERLKFLA